MKLAVQGIEEIEITDPQGLCNPPVPQLLAPPRGTPMPPNWPTPQRGTPMPPNWPTPQIPGGVAVPYRPTIYTRHVHDQDPLQRGKWEVGGPAIQQAAQEVDPDKWEQNWQ